MPDPISSIVNEMTPGAIPTPDPFAEAVAQSKAQYPRFANLPLRATDKGPAIENGSETYPPGEDNNPHPGNWTVQFNSKKMPTNLPGTISLEAIHALQATDLQYQRFTDQFVKSMTPDQMADAKRAYARDMKEAGSNFRGTGKQEPFDSWIRRVQGQEYIRGGIFTDVIPNWIGPKGEGRYTDQQTKLLDQIKKYLQTPANQ